MVRHLTPYQRLAVEALQEDERLTAGLTDDQAGPLLQWATEQAALLTRNVADEAGVDQVVAQVRAAVRAAARAGGAVEVAAQTLAGLMPALGAAALSETVAPSVESSAGVSPAAFGSATAPDSVQRRCPRRWPEVLPLSLLAHLARR